MPIHDPTPARFVDAGEGDAALPMTAPATPNELTPAKLRAWVREARPRARMIYAQGAFVDQHAPVPLVRLVRALYEAGFLRLHLKRPERGAPIDYIAVRTNKPVLAGTVL